MSEKKLPWEDASPTLPSSRPAASRAAASRAAASRAAAAGPAASRNSTAEKLPPRKIAKTPETYSNEMKLEVVLAALRGDATQKEIGLHYGIAQPLVSIWRASAIEAIRDNLSGKSQKRGPNEGQSDMLGKVLTKGDIVAIERLCIMLRDTARMLEDVPHALRSMVK